MVASDKIKKRMKELGIGQKKVAEELGISQCTVSQKLDNKRPFYLDEAMKLAKLLEIEAEFFSYFFAHKVA